MSRSRSPILALFVLLVAAGTVLASHVAPKLVDGSTSCGPLTPGTVELVVDASDLPAGAVSDGDFSATVTLEGTIETGTVAFRDASLPVKSAFVAGATSGNLYEYAEPVTSHGFVYMDTPGYDPVSATGQVAGGANMICFTTGRGSAYGCAPSPSLKLATNSALWQRQEEDMDINCGEIVEGTVSIQEMGQRIFELVLATASGEHSKSEQHGYGQNEFVPWQVGAVM